MGRDKKILLSLKIELELVARATVSHSIIYTYFIIYNQATFYWKAGWRIGRGPCSDSSCTEADIGRLGTNVDNGNGKDM